MERNQLSMTRMVASRFHANFGELLLAAVMGRDAPFCTTRCRIRLRDVSCVPVWNIGRVVVLTEKVHSRVMGPQLRLHVGGGSKGGKNGKGGGKSTRIKGGDEKSTKDGDPKVGAMDGCGKTTSSTTTTTSQDQGKNDEGPGDPPPPETSKNAETSGASETLMTEVSSLLKSIRLQGAGPQLRAYCVRSTAYESGNEGWTLLDGGATHCLRRKTSDKEWRESAVVKVQLASEEVEMRLHPVLNTLLVDHPVQQIVPLCKLTEVGWTVRWGHQGCTINHSALGTLPLELQQGCPVVPKEWGDRLMKKMVEENESSRFSVRAVIEGRRAPQSGFERDVNELKRLFLEYLTEFWREFLGWKMSAPNSCPSTEGKDGSWSRLQWW